MQEIPKMTGHGGVACVAGLLALLSPAAAFAQFTYTTNNNTIIITSYDCSSNTAVVPNTINGLPVASVGTGTFAECLWAS